MRRSSPPTPVAGSERRLGYPRVAHPLEILGAPGFPAFPSRHSSAPGLGRWGRAAASGAGQAEVPAPCASAGTLSRKPGSELASSPCGAAGRGRSSGRARAEGPGSPAPGAGRPEARADLPSRLGAGGVRTAGVAAGCGHRWAAAWAQLRGAGRRVRAAGGSDPSRLRLGLRGCSRTSTRSAGNFLAKVILRAGLRAGPAHDLTIGGGARGAGRGSCGRRWDGDAERGRGPSPGGLHEPGSRPAAARPSAPRTRFPPLAAPRVSCPRAGLRAGPRGRLQAHPEVHPQVRTDVRAPAVPRRAVGWRLGSGRPGRRLPWPGGGCAGAGGATPRQLPSGSRARKA